MAFPIATTPDASQRVSARNPETLVHGIDAGGRRAWLAGRPLYTGAAVEVLIGGSWLPGRVEATSISDPDGRTAAVMVLYLEGGPFGVPGAGARLRRPAKH